MEKTIFFDEQGYNNQVANYKDGLDRLNGLITTYNAIGLKSAIDDDDLQEMIADPKGWMYEKIVNREKLEIGGVAVKKDKAYELIERPAGCDAFLSELEEYVKEIFRPGGNFYINPENFVFHKGVAQIKPLLLERLKNSATYKAKTDKQVKSLDMLQNIADTLNKLAAEKGGVLRSDFQPEGNAQKLIEKAITFTGGKYVVNHHFISNIY